MLGSRQGNWRLKAALAASTVLTSGLADTAWAQVAGQVNPPPVRRPIDDNGVDVTRGIFVASEPGVGIGGGGAQGLSHVRTTDGVSTTLGTIELVGGTYLVTIDGHADGFTASGGGFTSTEGEGATLVLAGGIYTYTSREGVIARFASNSGYVYTFYEGELGRLGSITYPDGTVKTFTFKVVTYCPGGYESGVCQSPLYYVGRLSSVTNSNGFQLKFTYAFNDTPTIKVSDVNYADWGRVINVAAINNAIEACSPSADTCTLTGTWPKLLYAETPSKTVTDPLNRVTTYGGSSGTFTIKRPGASTPNITVTSNVGTGQVSSVLKEGVTYNYAYSDVGTVRTTTVTDPNSGVRTYVSDTTKFLISSYKDELNRTTSYLYDVSGRTTRITSPEGNYIEYTYDARGNLTQTRNVAKVGSGLADIITSAVFPASCTNPVICNKPTSTTDAKGNVTDFTYDATHGGVLTVTAPAATLGGIRPQTRYTYTLSGGIYRLTATSTCQTTASCAAAVDEVKTTIVYGTSNNYVTSVSSGAGNGSLTATAAFTYDNYGDRLTVDGPLTGTADTTRTRYDLARQVVGIIGPDPDGAGALKNRAQRLTYNLDGQVTSTEFGNVNSQSDPDWAAMTVAQNVSVTYDANARPVKQQLQASGTTYALGQISYDALGRVDCSATRMDPTVWASQTVVCTPQTTAANGPDRITKNIYDSASEVMQVQTAVGTADVSNEVTATFNANGTTATVKDAENNLTTYEYDGFDRLTKTRYPSTTQGSGTSSTTDYEQPAYDANGNITQRRLRDGLLINYGYDNLNRMTLKDLPGSEPDVSNSYDLLGRLTQASQTGNVLGFSYDALSRNLTQSGPLGSVAYQYDLASRRTRTTWPDAFYVTYDYLVTGDVTAIRENGAASGVGVLGTYAYDTLGRRTSLTRGNGTTTSYAFDPVSRLSSLIQDLAGTANDLTINGFSYNPASQIGALTRSNDAYAWSGHYNVNRNYTLNGLNQMTAAGATSLSYDGRGNLTTSGTNAYGYSSENLLLTGPASTTLGYDPGLRLYQTVGAGVTTRFQYDGGDMIGEYNASNALLRRYVHGPGTDEPLVWYEGSGTTDRRWLHADERGSVIAISDGSGTMLGLNRYDEYGIPQATNLGRFGYTGQTWLPEIGMNYYKARMYSPTLGRFMQSDPIGYDAGMNIYNYVGSDPVNFTDPSGLDRFGNRTTYRADPPARDQRDLDICGRFRINGACVGNTEFYFFLDSIFGSRSGVGNGDPIGPLGAGPLGPPPPPAGEKKTPSENTCSVAVGEKGPLLVEFATVSLIVGGGPTVSFGSFLNLKTGTTGNFRSIGGGALFDVGFSVSFGVVASAKLLSGGGGAFNLSSGAVTYSNIASFGKGSNGLPTFTKSGNSVGAAIGGRVGASGTLTGTKLTNCKLGGK